jgi:hypothetical protein
MYKKPAFELPDELPGPEIFKDGYWHVTQSKKENKMSELEIRERAINIAALHLAGENKDAAQLIAMAKQVYEYLTASAPVSPAQSSK